MEHYDHGIATIIICIIIAILIPEKYDPAIHIKKWAEKRKLKRD